MPPPRGKRVSGVAPIAARLEAIAFRVEDDGFEESVFGAVASALVAVEAHIERSAARHREEVEGLELRLQEVEEAAEEQRPAALALNLLREQLADVVRGVRTLDEVVGEYDPS